MRAIFEISFNAGSDCCGSRNPRSLASISRYSVSANDPSAIFRNRAYSELLCLFEPSAMFVGTDAAAETLVEIKIKQLERKGKKLSEEEKKKLYESVRSTYERQTDPRYAAARLWVDAIIDPAQNREALVWALEAASLNPEVREFRTGVLQT